MAYYFRGLLLMGLFFNHLGCSAQDKHTLTDRKPAVAGQFYPADAGELKSTLAGFFSHAKPSEQKNVTAIVCPHAGYDFSGQVAASGYNQVDPLKKYENVFVIASSHRVSFPGASIYNQGDYITPLGKVKVNIELANQLIRENAVFSYQPDADRTEHSLEVQIPFLQYHLKKEFNLVPIVIGAQSEKACREMAKALKPWFNERNLFVFSTDFSHYPSHADAQTADKATCDAIVSGSPDRLMKFLEEYREKNIPKLVTNLCGWTSILVLLNLISGDPQYTITPVHYMNSGDSKYEDKHHVVGYWSLAVTRSATGAEKPEGYQFSADEKIILLKIARNTIEKYIRERRIPETDTSAFSDNLKIHAGAFVTLKMRGELRGCIGQFSSGIPLYRLIAEMAVASSTQDSRFEPVIAGEIDKLDIEISVLSPMKKIMKPEEIVLGKHGIYIKKGHATGTFLPQVATETGWNVEEFLGRCSRDKAGLGWSGWKDADLYVYEAYVFSEKELNVRTD